MVRQKQGFNLIKYFRDLLLTGIKENHSMKYIPIQSNTTNEHLLAHKMLENLADKIEQYGHVGFKYLELKTAPSSDDAALIETEIYKMRKSDHRLQHDALKLKGQLGGDEQEIVNRQTVRMLEVKSQKGEEDSLVSLLRRCSKEIKALGDDIEVLDIMAHEWVDDFGVYQKFIRIFYI